LKIFYIVVDGRDGGGGVLVLVMMMVVVVMVAVVVVAMAVKIGGHTHISSILEPRS